LGREVFRLWFFIFKNPSDLCYIPRKHFKYVWEFAIFENEETILRFGGYSAKAVKSMSATLSMWRSLRLPVLSTIRQCGQMIWGGGTGGSHRLILQGGLAMMSKNFSIWHATTVYQ
jgi:hypothetical protein